MTSTAVFSTPADSSPLPQEFLPETPSDLDLRARLIRAGAQDAWVRRRMDRNGTAHVWAFAAVTRPIPLPKGCTATLVPVNRLPRDPAGHVDAKALAALPCPADTNAQRLITRLPVPDLTWQGHTQTAPVPPPARITQSHRPAFLDGGPVPPLRAGVTTLSDLLVQAARLPPQRGVTFLARGQAAAHLSYSELDRCARTTAAALLAAGLTPDDTVLCLYQDDEDRDAMTAIWGAIYAGLRPVPLLAPRSYVPGDAQSRRLCDAAALLPDATVLTAKAQQPAQSLLPGRRILNPGTLPAAAPRDPVPLDPERPAAFFLTSGSTAKPKVVPQTHAAILSLIAGCAEINELTSKDVSLNWLPMDHVGSFIMLHMRDTYLGARQLRAAGTDVLRDPLAWITWMSEHRATNGWAPNFAFELVTKALQDRPAPPSERTSEQAWDLSQLRFLHNGGEAVIQKTAAAFLGALTPFGIAASAVRPAWGMSETSSGSVFNPEFEPMQEQSGPIPVGRPAPGLQIRITDPAQPTKVLREGDTGLLQVAGPMVLKSYHRNPAKTKDSFAEPGWFTTGDLGRIENGNLYITGREKDVIIVNGLNLSPAELESQISRIDGVQPACTAVMQLGGGGGTDRIAVFFVPAPGAEAAELVPRIRRRLSSGSGLSADAIFALREADIPKTSIGKIQKEKLKARAEDGSLLPAWRKPQDTHDNRPSLWDTSWQPCPAVAAPGPLRAALCGPNAGYLTAALVAMDVQVSRLPARPLCAQDIESRATLVMLPGAVTDPFDAIPIVQNLARIARHQPVRAIWFCPGAATGSANCDPSSAMIAALLRSAAAECPALSLRLVDPGPEPVSAARLKAELADPAATPEVRWTAATRDVMCHAPVTAPKAEGITLKPGARYLVTGGLGGIGRALCEKLQGEFDADLIILGRRSEQDLPAEAKRALAGLRRQGRADYLRCNLAEPAALATLRDVTCDGVFHLAGLAAYAPLDSLNPQQAEQEARAKTLGTETLLTAATAIGAGWVAAFGSVIGTFGSAGYAGYAMANRYLQARAGTDGQCRLVTLNWSMWDGVGVSAGFHDTSLVTGKGFDLMSTERALSALVPALETGLDNVLIGLDPSRPALAHCLSGELVSLAETTPASGTIEDDPLTRQLCGIWALILNLPAPARGSDNIFDLGATSLDLPQVQERITQTFGCDIDVLDLFDHPKIAAFAEHLKTRLTA